MKLLTLVSFLTALSLPIECSAQAGGMPARGAAGRPDTEQVLTRDTLSQSELKRLAEQMDQWSRVAGKTGVSPAVAKSRTAAMLGVLKVPCAVSQAEYRGSAPDAAQHIYEAACEDGMGYLLTLHAEQLRGASCLTAALDESPVKCAMAGNADARVIAAAVLSRNNVPCQVRDLKWLGANAESLDHIEVACEGGGGHVVRAPRPGSSGRLEVLGCPQAGKQGIACQLSANASATAAGADSRPGLAWFKDRLAANNIPCQSKRARIVGRESIKRRYVVEFECTDRPDGLVALVPSAGDSASPFESMNCASAAGRGIHCQLLSAPAAAQ